MKTCQICQSPFEINDDDRRFYEKIDVLEPKKCPPCRMQQRVLFRNFTNLYHSKSDLSGKSMISMYDKEKSFPVYEITEWWGDQWDELDHGFVPDFNRTVFEQLKTLHQNVPHMNIMNHNCENSDYSNLSFNTRNTYLMFGNVDNQDCYYGHIVWQSENCFDCLYVYRSKFCYECVDCLDCYNLAFCQDCSNCSDSKFLLDCIGCRDCFGCVGLRNKQYYIFNQPYSKKEYEAKMKEFNSGNIHFVQLAKSKIQELKKSHKVKHYHGNNNENVTGDYLYNCKNVFNAYDIKGGEDIRYCATLERFKDAYDCNYSPKKTELAYNCVAVTGYGLIGCHNCTENSNLEYCDNCYNSKDCFGSVGLRNKQYCIFNKQYSKEAYFELRLKLIEKMKTDGEWGEFFPADFSPFAYNETMAQEYFPLTKEEALKKGYRWKDETISEGYRGPVYQVPEDIAESEDDICKKILICEVSKKPYKIIPQELQFYKEQNLPIPRRSWEQRHKDRMALKNPRRLWSRECEKCQKEIQTTYAPERPEKIYCEGCYLNETY